MGTTLSYAVLRGKKFLKNQPLGLSFLLGRNYLHLNWKKSYKLMHDFGLRS